MSELVSIIIPVYNAGAYLEECLYSVVEQTYKHLEVIIINDGSTDHSEEIILKYSKRDNRIQYYQQENHGLGYTRNRGISLSKGTYLFFLDSDDTIPKEAIESLVLAIEKCEADYSVGKVLRFNNERKYVPIRHLEYRLYNQNQCTSISENTELIQDSIACNKLWRRKFVKKHQLLFTEGKYYEDLVFTLKAAVLSKRIAVINKVVYGWRVREEENKPSITQQQMKLINTLDRISALSNNRKWMIQTNVDQRIREEHDLKSILDILRLHVVKYSLISKTEREDWVKEVTSFLKIFPKGIVIRLPNKEKNLFNLLIEGNLFDLELFSQMYMNAETYPVVKQEGQRFILNGKEQSYDVTTELKPTLKIIDIKSVGGKWLLSGHLIVPKASFPIDGSFYAKGRKRNQPIEIKHIDYNLSNPNAIYPYEKQVINMILDPKLFQKVNNETVFDFYFKLKGDGQEHPSTRVRNMVGENTVKIGFSTYSLFKTNYGNLSLQIKKGIGIKRVLKKILNK